MEGCTYWKWGWDGWIRDNVAAAIPQVQLPVGWGAPLTHPAPVVPVVGNLAATIPQVQLPAGWDAPLANPVPMVPPAPQL